MRTHVRASAVDVELTMGPMSKPLAPREALSLSQFQQSAVRRGFTVTVEETERSVTVTATLSTTPRAAAGGA